MRGLIFDRLASWSHPVPVWYILYVPHIFELNIWTTSNEDISFLPIHWKKFSFEFLSIPKPLVQVDSFYIFSYNYNNLSQCGRKCRLRPAEGRQSLHTRLKLGAVVGGTLAKWTETKTQRCLGQVFHYRTEDQPFRNSQIQPVCSRVVTWAFHNRYRVVYRDTELY